MHRSKLKPLLILYVVATASLLAQGDTAYPSPIIASPGQGIQAGAELISTAQFTIAKIEDQLLGTSWMPENTVTGKLVGVAGRSLKFAFLDLPLDYFSIVLMHEWYGHGARYRDLGLTGIDYGYDWPPPYGEGGGYASYYSSPGEFSTQERLGIWIGGIESQQVLNRNLRQRWMITGSMHYRQSWLYFWSMQNMLAYIADALDLVEGQQNFNDPQAFIYLLNADNGIHSISDYPFVLDDLQQRANLNTLDPFFWFSIYNNLVTYLWGGQVHGTIPTLKLGDLKYLPSIHAGLTPFGMETYLENYIIYDEVLYMLYARLGDNSYYDNWGGLGGLVSYPFARSVLSADVKFDLWKQPPMKLGGTEVEKGGGLGAALSVRAYYKLPNVTVPMKAIVEVGYKGVGFLEGYPLDKAPILLFGVQL